MSGVCHAYDSEFMQSDENEGLHLWCLDRNSQPIHLIIKNSPIYLYIELPETPLISKWDEDSVELLYRNFVKTHGKVAPFLMEYTEREKLYYYKGEDSSIPMARLFFKSPRDMNICNARLVKNQEYADFGGMIFRTFEKDISVRRKISTIRRTRYCQWFEFSGVEIPFSSKIRQATEGKPGREIREYVIEDYNNITSIDPKVSAGWSSSPTVLSWDIETYSDNHHQMPDKTNEKHVVYMISCLAQVTGDPSTREKYVIVSEDVDPIDGVTVLKAKDEEELILLFLELIEHVDPEIIMGYNIFAYDYPYLDARFSMRRECYEPCSRIQGYIPEMSNSAWASGAYGQTIISYLKMPGRISIDLFPLIKRDYKFDKYTLDFVAGELLGSSKHDVSAQQMFKAYESKDVKEMTRVTRYCIQDADLVIDLYEKMRVWIGLVEMANIVGVEIMDLFTRGQQIRCVSQIYDLTAKKKIVLNSRDPVVIDYKGGFVGDPIKGLHDFVICLDFSSLYPSIMMAFNICYTTLVPEIYAEDYTDDEVHTIVVDEKTRYRFVKAHIRKGVLPQLVENLVSERSNVRKEIKVLESRLKELRPKDATLDQIEAYSQNIKDEIKQIELSIVVLDKRQLALKVSANSMYGFLGVQTGGKLPLIEGAVSITAKGRQLINEVNDFLVKEYDATVVYNDTDSSMVTIPAIKDAKEVNKWGQMLADRISGKPEVRDENGNVITPAVTGLFPPPLKMEFEKGMRFIGITKKKYAAFLIDGKGEFKKDRTGEEEIYKRGIVIARRDNFPFLRKKYTEVLRSILRRNPIEYTFKLILDGVIDLISGNLPVRGNLTIIRGLGKEYASDGAFMKVFADELASRGHPVSAGDRLEYVVIEGDAKVPLGRKMRLIEMYEDSVNYDEKTEGPRPFSVYPKEKLDYMYYLTHGFQNPLDQLFSSGYIKELYGTTLHESGYNPKNSASKPVPISTPIKLISAMIKDNLKNKMTLDDCISYLKKDFYNWFLTELKDSKPLDTPINLKEIEDFDVGGEDEGEADYNM